MLNAIPAAKPPRKPLREVFDIDTPHDPNALFDALLARLMLKNDAALCRVLDVAPPMISKVRHGRLPLSAALMLRLHEVTGIAVADLRAMMAVAPR